MPNLVWASVETLVMIEGANKLPRLALLCGLPAAGKTTVARELADAYRAVRLQRG
jgi:adenylylsulfate kinase-like enzyme